MMTKTSKFVSLACVENTPSLHSGILVRVKAKVQLNVANI